LIGYKVNWLEKKRDERKKELAWKIWKGVQLNKSEAITAFALKLLLPKSEKAKVFYNTYREEIRKEERYWYTGRR